MGYLVVCMTAGAAVLSLAEPPRPPATPRPEQDASPAEAIDDITACAAHTWQGVVVHCTAPQAPARRRLLFATDHRPAPQAYHFVVRPDGTIITSPAWRQQKPIGPDPLGLHIALAGGRLRTAIPRLQWNAFCELLAHLQQRFCLDPERIELAEASDIDAFPDHRERVRRFLLSVGITG
ncbi:MAG: N-acetylmuramoyl-L-alanine amidase [Phycisphaerales bacterium]|nr:MAG: N-acetylmuramoyl-L-alanine amidase [Phycisphaerales bacterium]